MAISDTIQSMYENVGEVYDTITNVTIPEHKNIENIPRTIRDSYLEIINNGINVIYDNWEKVTGEGTSLTLTPTEEAPMKIVLKGNTYQEGTPTPDTPIPVQVVSGDNSIEVCGKNLQEQRVANATIGNVGVFSNATGYDLGIAKINQGQEYVISGIENPANYQIVLGFFYSKPTFGSVTYDNSRTILAQKIMTFTAPITGYVAFRVNSTDLYTMIEKGNTATTYEPYTGASYPINLPEGMFLGWIPNTTYQDKIDKSTGKNLVEGKITGYYVDNVGKFNANANYDMHIAKVVEGQTYTATTNESQLVCGFFTSYPIVGSTTYNNSRLVQDSKTFTAPITGYIAFRTLSGYSFAMLNKGTTALPYEPYGTSWYLKKEIGKVVLNGSNTETWEKFGLQDKVSFYTNISNGTGLQTISNYFKEQTTGNYPDYNHILYNGNSNKNMIFRLSDDTTITTVANFRTWLSTHNTEVYYVLATPTYTLIEGELLNQLEAIKMSYEGQTNISQANNDMPFILNPSALKKV